MPGSNRTPTSPARRRRRGPSLSGATPPRDTQARVWRECPVEGPLDLYMAFAWDAVSEFFHEEMRRMTDKETFFLLDAVRLAASVALHAANVDTSWVQSYEKATAHLRQEEEQEQVDW